MIFDLPGEGGGLGRSTFPRMLVELHLVVGIILAWPDAAEEPRSGAMVP